MKIKYSEVETIYTMISIYCKNNHHTKELCSECDELFEYAKQRIDRCPKKETKTFCSSCSIHCYKPDMRQKIKTVMKYAGPRMLYKNPVLALAHVVNTIKEKKK